MSATFLLSALFLATTSVLLARRLQRASLRPLLRRAR